MKFLNFQKNTIYNVHVFHETVIHPLIMFDANLDNQLERAENLVQKFWNYASEELFGEHGVGIENYVQFITMKLNFS